MKIYVDCPICCSRNTYRGEIGEQLVLTCSDCGEIVSSSGKLHVIDSNQLESCIICGYNKFHKEYFFPPTWLFGVITCYCCDSRYYGYAVPQNIHFYSEKVAKALRSDPCFENWRKYAGTVFARQVADVKIIIAKCIMDTVRENRNKDIPVNDRAAADIEDLIPGFYNQYIKRGKDKEIIAVYNLLDTYKDIQNEGHQWPGYDLSILGKMEILLTEIAELFDNNAPLDDSIIAKAIDLTNS